MSNDLSTLNNLTDAALIRRTQNRDETAFAELMSRYSPRIWRVIVTNSRQHRDAEEILMDVWMSVWENIDKLQKVDSFSGWLRRIAYNACNRYYATAHHSRTETPQHHETLVEHIDREADAHFREANLRADVREVVHHLPQRVRSVAVLYYLESWRIKDIAAKLDLAIGTVKTKLREIRSLLREEFGVEPKSRGIMSSESVHQHNHKDYIQRYLPEGAIARFGKGYPFDFEYFSDGTRLAVGSTIGIWIYDMRTGEELDLLTGHTYYVNRVIFSPDGKTLASMSRWNDHIIRLWDGVTSEPKATLTGHTSEINNIVFSPDGKTLASASDDNTVCLWDGVTGDLKTILREHTANVKVLAVSPDGSRLASGGNDEVIRLWNVATGELLLTFAAHVNSVDTLMYSPDGERIASHGGDGNVCLWNAQTGEFLHLLSDHRKDVAVINFSKDGETLATASYDGTIQVWHTETGAHLKTVNAGTELYSMSYSPDGSTYVCDDDEEGRILLYDANTDQLLRTFKLPSRGVGNMKYSPDGQTLVGADQFGLHFWDIDTGHLSQTITGYSEVINSVVYSPDGRTLVSLSGVLRFWDVETGKLLRTLTPESAVPSMAAYSPDGQTLACGTPRQHDSVMERQPMETDNNA